MSATIARRTSPRRLNWTYAIPSPVLNEDQHRRYHHADLPNLARWQLDAELTAVNRRLFLERDKFDRAWLIARRSAIRNERLRRGQEVAA